MIAGSQILSFHSTYSDPIIWCWKFGVSSGSTGFRQVYDYCVLGPSG